MVYVKKQAKIEIIKRESFFYVKKVNLKVLMP
jgi:hypothetical protein